MINDLTQQPKSSVLILGHPDQAKVQLGAHCVNDFQETLSALQESKYSTLVFPLALLSAQNLKVLYESIQSNNPNIKTIVVDTENSSDKLLFSVNLLNTFKIIDSFEDSSFEKYIVSANEAYAQHQQNQQLIELFNEQNEKLRTLKDNLENRIQKRKKSLIKSQKRFELLSHAVQTLHKALIIIHKQNAPQDLEAQLSELLTQQMNIKAVHLNSTLNESESEKVLNIPLIVRNENIGRMSFILDNNVELLKDELNILYQIADATALSTDRILKRKQAEVFKKQWEAAFNSIQDPICITNSQHQIIRTNNAFLEEKLSEKESVLGEDCFEIFFEDKSTLKGAQKIDGNTFFQKIQTRLAETSSKTFDVTLQNIPYLIHEDDLCLVYFRDVSETLKLERQILESSKMAELGTISSSIAHELNNPLGGMLSYLQLIKMDLAKESPVRDDIESMLESSLRCKEIIENLLGFARRTQGQLSDKVFLIEVIEKSVKILELQTKATNIHIEIDTPKEDPAIKGNFNLLTQALCNILQNSVDAIKHKYVDSPRYDGQIRIELKPTPQAITLIISDNGTGIKPEYQSLLFNPLFTTKNPDHNSGLGLTVAFQIINEHGGTLDLFSQPMAGTSAKIAFLRPDLTN